MISNFTEVINNLPSDLFENRSLFNNIINSSILQHIDKTKLNTILNKHLPTELDNEKKLETVQQLLDNKLNFLNLNPMDNFYKQVKIQKFSPDLINSLNEIKKLKNKALRLEELKLQCNLLNELISKKRQFITKVLDSESYNVVYSNETSNTNKNKINKNKKVRLRFMKELKEILSSDDEEFNCDNDFYTGLKNNKSENYIIDEKKYFKLLKAYKKKKLNLDLDENKRKLKSDFNGVTLKEIFDRVNNKISCEIDKKDIKNDTFVKRKRPIDESKDYKKKLFNQNQLVNEIDKISESNNDVSSSNSEIKLMDYEESFKSVSSSLEIIQNTNQIENTDKQLVDYNNLSPNLEKSYQTPPASFFSLIRNIFYSYAESNYRLTLHKLEELVREELRNFDPKIGWAHELVQSAMNYLSGVLPPPKMVPLVDYKEKNQQWQWIGNDCDEDEVLLKLCKEWKSELNKHSLLDPSKPVPPAICPTDWTVKESSLSEKISYREQEIQRYKNPNKSFTFYLHGYKSVVGPVKGCSFHKDSSVQATGLTKSREKTLLLKERPAFVTLLSLVRDSAARLPNGEGTRADICELLKDSQFLMDDISEQQMSAIVSGALDRLHYEKDPCVKYDVQRKIWVYLHRYRSEEDFNRLHQMQIEAHIAKKNLNKNQKRSNGKPSNVLKNSQMSTNKREIDLTESVQISTYKEENQIGENFNDSNMIRCDDNNSFLNKSLKKLSNSPNLQKITIKPNIIRIKTKNSDDKNSSSSISNIKTDFINKTIKQKYQKRNKKCKISKNHQSNEQCKDVNNHIIKNSPIKSSDKETSSNLIFTFNNNLNKNLNIISSISNNTKEGEPTKTQIPITVQNSHRINLPANMILNGSPASILLAPSTSNSLNGIKSFTMTTNGNQIVLHPQTTALTNLTPNKNKLITNLPLTFRTIQGIRVLPLQSPTTQLQTNSVQPNKSSNIVAKLITSGNITKNLSINSNQTTVSSSNSSLTFSSTNKSLISCSPKVTITPQSSKS